MIVLYYVYILSYDFILDMVTSCQEILRVCTNTT